MALTIDIIVDHLEYRDVTRLNVKRVDRLIRCTCKGSFRASSSRCCSSGSRRVSAGASATSTAAAQSDSENE